MRFIVAFLAVLFPQQAIACLDEEQSGYAERAKTISSTEICNAVSSGIVGHAVNCTNGIYEIDDILVKVTRGLGVVVQFDIFFIGPSEKLSGKVSNNGYESHKFKTMFFLDFSCRNVLWRYAYEPRYLKGSFDIAKNVSNPNWTLYSDNDRISSLSESVQSWILNALIEKK